MRARLVGAIASIGAVTLVLLPSFATAGLFGPSTYDECITDAMKGVTSDVAARAIIKACRERFPPPPPPPIRALTSEELANLRITGLKLPGGLMGTLYNDNTKTTVTRAVLAVTLELKGKPATYECFADVRADPSGRGDFTALCDLSGADGTPKVQVKSAAGY